MSSWRCFCRVMGSNPGATEDPPCRGLITYQSSVRPSFGLRVERKMSAPTQVSSSSLDCGSKFSGCVNINVTLFRYSRAFGDGPRHFELWTSDVDVI
ncbi:hypothetical protein TNCV_1089251 [Trichonephila clavipes]|uniref:Uncharacterized protein n=1 Tax=Trichonephila clavipes TaxID=2585209 RepID=A0A8X6VL73_TRICX|nr:hypothetical protein TNCV_1089251 [Trichonephila clavipes]